MIVSADRGRKAAGGLTRRDNTKPRVMAAQITIELIRRPGNQMKAVANVAQRRAKITDAANASHPLI